MKNRTRLTESDLNRIVKRVIKEQPNENGIPGVVNLDEQFIALDGASKNTVNRILKRLPFSLKFLSIQNSEFADFESVDICDLPNLSVITLKGTPNNFEEFCDCLKGKYGDMYVFS